MSDTPSLVEILKIIGREGLHRLSTDQFTYLWTTIEQIVDRITARDPAGIRDDVLNKTLHTLEAGSKSQKGWCSEFEGEGHAKGWLTTTIKRDAHRARQRAARQAHPRADRPVGFTQDEPNINEVALRQTLERIVEPCFQRQRGRGDYKDQLQALQDRCRVCLGQIGTRALIDEARAQGERGEDEQIRCRLAQRLRRARLTLTRHLRRLEAQGELEAAEALRDFLNATRLRRARKR